MAKKRFLSGKTYTHSTGHSCAFRQWRADSHCNLIHGYALQFELTFGSTGLDEKNWVVDFGGLKELKEWLKHMFDHTTVVASDDPELSRFEEMDEKGLIQLRVIDDVGCEKFAQYVFEFLNKKIKEQTKGRVKVHKVQCWEHGENMAEYRA